MTQPFCVLLDAGVKVTLNSDELPYFGASLGRGYERAAQEMQLGEQALRNITSTAINRGLVDDDTKKTLYQRAIATDWTNCDIVDAVQTPAL